MRGGVYTGPYIKRTKYQLSARRNICEMEEWTWYKRKIGLSPQNLYEPRK